MKPVIIHSRAGAELEEAVAFYEQRMTGLGMELQTAVERAVEMIQDHPRSAPPYKATEFRYYPLRRFPYVVFYAELQDVIWIVAIAHGRRRPDYWERRRIE